jgi:hypothetical protein
MCLSATKIYTSDQTLLSVRLVVGASALVSSLTSWLWAWLATFLGQWLSISRRLQPST